MITQPSMHVYSILGLSRASELIHNEKGVTALAYTVGVGQSYNGGLLSGESEKGVADKSTELGVSTFLT